MTEKLNNSPMIDRLMKIYPKRDISESLVSLVSSHVHEGRLEALQLPDLELKHSIETASRAVEGAEDKEGQEFWSKRLKTLLAEACGRLGLPADQQRIRKKRILKESKQSVWEEIERRLEEVEDGKPVEDDDDG